MDIFWHSEHTAAMEWQPDPAQYPAFLRRKIARGRGCRAGSSYLPWYTTREIRSMGNCDTPNSIRNGRQYELLSDFETLYFYLLERKQSVLDLREQFPIFDLARTQQLAAEFGIPHKRVGRYPEPYTIDFLVTENIEDQHVLRAASIKPPDIEFDAVTSAKLSIEHQWCEEQGIRWELIDLSTLPDPQVTLSTLRFLRRWRAHGWQPEPVLGKMVRDHFMHVYERNIPLSTLLKRTAQRLRLKSEQAEDAFRYGAWAGDINISLNHEVALNLPLVLRNDEV
ncbi:TnsA endonuclease N-terminal domain-containing protein [Paracidovorax cattleyae]|uniref:TnsA endonuclease N-terminal domain-containing protein n=1 Tax=Paracidovorax cattleyae TaxID=80868 RepID=UPI0018AFB020|nr:TnsA endonuclease N-terminal domain-containing protein [Paracidovorax cattleyae]MBF9263337.1 Tn7 transposase TnsA N-terminal domain-containing protein [Paracidovorax cattleyae]